MFYYFTIDIESQPYTIIATDMDDLMEDVAEFFEIVVKYGLNPEKYVDQIVDGIADYESFCRLSNRGFKVEFVYQG